MLLWDHQLRSALQIEKEEGSEEEDEGPEEEEGGNSLGSMVFLGHSFSEGRTSISQRLPFNY